MFVNPLSVRVRFAGVRTFGELVALVHGRSAAAYEHSRYPFGLLVQQLNPARTPGRNPVFSTAFQFADFLPPAYQTSQLDICLYGTAREDHLALRLSYDSRRLTADEVAEVEATFRAVIRGVLAEDDPELAAFTEPMALARAELSRQSVPVRRGRLQAAIAARQGTVRG
jgi:non-ribosomal peptide synthetase component F